jgi:hypothetical protein
MLDRVHMRVEVAGQDEPAARPITVPAVRQAARYLASVSAAGPTSAIVSPSTSSE